MQKPWNKSWLAAVCRADQSRCGCVVSGFLMKQMAEVFTFHFLAVRTLRCVCVCVSRVLTLQMERQPNVLYLQAKAHEMK